MVVYVEHVGTLGYDSPLDRIGNDSKAVVLIVHHRNDPLGQFEQEILL